MSTEPARSRLQIMATASARGLRARSDALGQRRSRGAFPGLRASRRAHERRGHPPAPRRLGPAAPARARQSAEPHVLVQDRGAARASTITSSCPTCAATATARCPSPGPSTSTSASARWRRTCWRSWTSSAIDKFFVAGHDRGARTTHRMCMDHPERILKVCLMDIVPNHYVWTHITKSWVIGTWHWASWRSPSRFPERLISAVPAEYFLKSRMVIRGGTGLGFLTESRARRIRALLYAEDDHRLVPRLSRDRDVRLRDGHRRQGQEARDAADAAVGRARPSARARARVPRYLAAVRDQHRGVRSRCPAATTCRKRCRTRSTITTRSSSCSGN